MKSTTYILIGLMLCAFAATAFADTIIMSGKDNVRKMKINRITTDGVGAEDGTFVRFSDLKQVDFDNIRFPLSESYIEFTDGSRLTGSVVSREKGVMTFRTPSFGDMSVSTKFVSKVVYDRYRFEKSLEKTKNKDIELPESAVVMADGSIVAGRVYYAESGTVGFSSGRTGMNKFIARAQVSGAIFRGTDDKKFITLSNGDIINSVNSFGNGKFDAKIGDSEIKDIPFSAISSITGSAADTKSDVKNKNEIQEKIQ